MPIALNFVWISNKEVKSGALPIPNTDKAPYIANINQWARLNPECRVD